MFHGRGAENDLFDEYRLLISPVILAGGKSLFDKVSTTRKLRFLDARPLTSGGVILRYEPAREA